MGLVGPRTGLDDVEGLIVYLKKLYPILFTHERKAALKP
jgi:hypothetical protein